ncbi:unnamed protein product [Amoebophrya sp. A120]|nr:unnamed protein product [Amoebophrya sp. A120]|eukprot:GSA120T00012829001.1
MSDSIDAEADANREPWLATPSPPRSADSIIPTTPPAQNVQVFPEDPFFTTVSPLNPMAPLSEPRLPPPGASAEDNISREELLLVPNSDSPTGTTGNTMGGVFNTPPRDGSGNKTLVKVAAPIASPAKKPQVKPLAAPAVPPAPDSMDVDELLLSTGRNPLLSSAEQHHFIPDSPDTSASKNSVASPPPPEQSIGTPVIEEKVKNTQVEVEDDDRDATVAEKAEALQQQVDKSNHSPDANSVLADGSLEGFKVVDGVFQKRDLLSPNKTGADEELLPSKQPLIQVEGDAYVSCPAVAATVRLHEERENNPEHVDSGLSIRGLQEPVSQFHSSSVVSVDGATALVAGEQSQLQAVSVQLSDVVDHDLLSSGVSTVLSSHGGTPVVATTTTSALLVEQQLPSGTSSTSRSVLLLLPAGRVIAPGEASLSPREDRKELPKSPAKNKNATTLMRSLVNGGTTRSHQGSALNSTAGVSSTTTNKATSTTHLRKPFAKPSVVPGNSTTQTPRGTTSSAGTSKSLVKGGPTPTNSVSRLAPSGAGGLMQSATSMGSTVSAKSAVSSAPLSELKTPTEAQVTELLNKPNSPTTSEAVNHSSNPSQSQLQRRRAYDQQRRQSGGPTKHSPAVRPAQKGNPTYVASASTTSTSAISTVGSTKIAPIVPGKGKDLAKTSLRVDEPSEVATAMNAGPSDAVLSSSASPLASPRAALQNAPLTPGQKQVNKNVKKATPKVSSNPRLLSATPLDHEPMSATSSLVVPTVSGSSGKHDSKYHHLRKRVELEDAGRLSPTNAGVNKGTTVVPVENVRRVSAAEGHLHFVPAARRGHDAPAPQLRVNWRWFSVFLLTSYVATFLVLRPRPLPADQTVVFRSGLANHLTMCTSVFLGENKDILQEQGTTTKRSFNGVDTEDERDFGVTPSGDAAKKVVTTTKPASRKSKSSASKAVSDRKKSAAPTSKVVIDSSMKNSSVTLPSTLGTTPRRTRTSVVKKQVAKQVSNVTAVSRKEQEVPSMVRNENKGVAEAASRAALGEMKNVAQETKLTDKNGRTSEDFPVGAASAGGHVLASDQEQDHLQSEEEGNNKPSGGEEAESAQSLFGVIGVGVASVVSLLGVVLFSGTDVMG